jgi:hypothetical protein
MSPDSRPCPAGIQEPRRWPSRADRAGRAERRFNDFLHNVNRGQMDGIRKSLHSLAELHYRVESLMFGGYRLVEGSR